jgi:hypothetical protein
LVEIGASDHPLAFENDEYIASTQAIAIRGFSERLEARCRANQQQAAEALRVIGPLAHLIGRTVVGNA